MRYLLALLIAIGWPAASQAGEFTTLITIAIATAKVDTPAPINPKVARKDCTVCKGTGRVKTGDGLSTTECENCEAPATAFNSGIGLTVTCECATTGVCSVCPEGGCACPNCPVHKPELALAEQPPKPPAKKPPVAKAPPAAKGEVCVGKDCPTSQKSMVNQSVYNERRRPILGFLFQRRR